MFESMGMLFRTDRHLLELAYVIKNTPKETTVCLFITEKYFKMLKKMILISKWHAKHPFAGLNTQHIRNRGMVAQMAAG